MKLKTRIISTIMSMTLALGVMAFAVYAAATQTLSITNTVSFVSTHVLATVTGVVTGAREGTYANYASSTTTADDDDGVLGNWAAGANMEFASENTPIFLTITVVNNSLQRALSFELSDYNYGAWNGVNLLDTNITRAVTYSITNASPVVNASYASGQFQVEPTKVATIVIRLDITDTGMSVNEFDNSFTMTLRNIGENNGEGGSGNFVFNPALKTLTIPANEEVSYDNLPTITNEATPALYGFYTSTNYLDEERVELPQTFAEETTLYAKVDALPTNLAFQLYDNYYSVSGVGVMSGEIELPAMVNDIPVKEIEQYAFSGWSKNGITYLSIPETIAYISDSTLSNSILADERYDVVNGVLYAGKVALRFVEELTVGHHLQFREDTIGIASGFMSGVFSIANLETITFPSTLEFIGEFAFSANGEWGSDTKLTTLSFPSSVKRVGNYAFKGSSLLHTITFEGQPEEVGYQAFHDTAWYSAQSSGMIYFGTVMYGFKGTITAGDLPLTFNAGTTFIGGLTEQSALNSITIPASVKVIGDHCFNDYNWDINLETVIFEEGSQLQKIGGFAFYQSNFTSIALPSTLQIIGRSAFEYTRVNSIVLPNSVTRVDTMAFANAYSTSLTLSDNLTTITKETFAYCESLAGTITIPAKVRVIMDSAFSGNVVDEFVFEHDAKIEVIDTYAFSYCYAIENIIIPINVAVMGEMVFASSSLLTVINVVASAAPITWHADWNLDDDYITYFTVVYNYVG